MEHQSSNMRYAKQDVSSIVKHIKQSRILKSRHKLLMRFLLDYAFQYGKVCPSVRTLAEQCSVSRVSIHRWITELENLGVLRRINCFRRNGGKTSNVYQFILEGLHGHIKQVKHLFSTEKKNVSHEANPDDASASIKKKEYRIKPEDMKKGQTAVEHYRNAVERRWISSSENDRFCWFTLWAHCVRRHREGKVRNPAAYLVSCIKRGLVNQIGSKDDERTASKVLSNMRLELAY